MVSTARGQSLSTGIRASMVQGQLVSTAIHDITAASDGGRGTPIISLDGPRTSRAVSLHWGIDWATLRTDPNQGRGDRLSLPRRSQWRPIRGSQASYR